MPDRPARGAAHELQRTKYCTHCERDKPLDQFASNGQGTLTSRCKSCKRYFSREYARRMRQDPRWRKRVNARRRQLVAARSPRFRRRRDRLELLARPMTVTGAARWWGIGYPAALCYLKLREREGRVRRLVVTSRRVAWVITSYMGRSAAKAVELARQAEAEAPSRSARPPRIVKDTKGTVELARPQLARAISTAESDGDSAAGERRGRRAMVPKNRN